MKTMKHKKKYKDDLNKWRIILCSWTRRLNVVKMPILPIFIYRVGATLIKILEDFFVEIGKLILKFVRKRQEPRLAQAILKNNLNGELTLPDIKNELHN